jgi:hypothetical protein
MVEMRRSEARSTDALFNSSGFDALSTQIHSRPFCLSDL